MVCLTREKGSAIRVVKLKASFLLYAVFTFVTTEEQFSCAKVNFGQSGYKFGLNVQVNKVDESYYLQCAKNIRIYISEMFIHQTEHTFNN